MHNNTHVCGLTNKPHFLSISCITLTIVLVFFFVIERIFLYSDSSANMFINRMWMCIFISSICLYLTIALPNVIEHIFIICISLWTCLESVKGLSQIYGNVTSRNPMFVLTGSFLNPGPYGGFLAIMACILISWLVKHMKMRRSLYCKIEYMIVIIALLAAVIVIPASQSRAAVLAVFCSMTLLALSNTAGRSFMRRHCYLLVILVIFFSIIGYYYKKPSADGRFMIYKIDLKALIEGGAFGSGFGHFAGAYGDAQYEYFSRDVTIKDGILDLGSSFQKDRYRADSPEFAFNDALQIGIEAGIVAMLLYIGIIVISTIILILSDSPFAFGIIALSVFGLFSYPISLWQFQLLLTLFVSVAISESINILRHNSSTNQLAFLVIPIVLMFFKANNIVYTVKNYREWEITRYLYYVREYDTYAECCMKISNSLDYIDDFLIEYGFSLAKIGNIERSDSILKKAINVNCSPQILMTMGDNRMARNDYKMAEQLYIKSFVLLPDRLAPLCKLAKLYAISGDTLSLINMKNSIENFHPRIESNLTESLREEAREF